MSISIFLFLSIITTSSCFDNDFILCRICGNNIVTTRSIIDWRSSSSVSTFTDFLFNTENVLIQVLAGDFFFQFPVIVASHSNCTGTGEWEEEKELWFPGYRWKPCVCSDCGASLGWVFEKYNNSDTIQDPEKFYALIIPHLIDQKFLDSLIVYPQH
ncbi:uncharacterized protein LOC126971136 [Leptidea sinapis]|uniref:uncharacterized protein LOC126971136 n=1 Tax=Leptidea sinapis TaxID=189913 RepID=UPI00214008B6|nr:uncharacterized protein LOC126971136 [Leptidea sinapis]